MDRPKFRRGDRVAMEWEYWPCLGTVLRKVEGEDSGWYKVRWDDGTVNFMYEDFLIGEEAHKRSQLSEMLGGDVLDG